MKKINFYLLITVIIAFIFVFIKTFFPFRIEIISQLMFLNNIIEFLYNISLAFIASSFFYFIVVVLKEKRDKKNIHPYLIKQIQSIVTILHFMFSMMAEKAKIELKTKFPTEEIIKEVLKNIKPDEFSSTIKSGDNKYYSWIEFIHIEIQLIKNKINNILTVKYFDSELLAKVTELTDCKLYRRVEMELKYRPNDQNLDYLSSFLLDFVEKIENLHNFSKEYFNNYK